MSKYITRVRRNQHVPWGYKISDYDPQLFEPIEEELDLLEKAFDYMRYCSSHEVARWLTQMTGRPISHAGLIKYWRNPKHRNNKRNAGIQRRYRSTAA